MKLLGAVLAGGRSSRFGSDKAEAVLDGATLLDRAISAIAPHCEAMVIVGRTHGTLPGISDWPAPGMGPLGGLAGALTYARDHGFDAVLSSSVDCGALSDEMVAALAPAPAHLASQPVIGVWPVSALDAAQVILKGDGRHSVKRFAAEIGSRAVPGFAPDNINTPADLEAARRSGSTNPA